MKKFILGILLALFLIVFLAYLWLINPVLTEKSMDKSLANPDLLKDHVEALAKISPSRNYQNLQSLNRAATYIQDQFKAMGHQPQIQKFTAQRNLYQNIIVRLGPKDGDKIIIGAHYDVAGFDNPGADDNASGIAGLIELARLLKEQKPKLSKPVELVAYSLEEPPFFGTKKMGSAEHAASLKKQKQNISLMISLEMIGYFSNEKHSQKYPLSLFHLVYPSRGNFIALVGVPKDWLVTRRVKSLFKSGSDLPIYSINAPKAVPGIALSDHSSYFTFGWPALMITDTAFYRNDQYHLSGDTPDRLDYRKMAQVVDGVYSIITHY